MIALYALAGGIAGIVRMLAGALVMLGLCVTYDAVIDDPTVRAQERTVMRARVDANTLKKMEERNATNRAVEDAGDADLCRELGGVQCDGQP